MCVTHLVRRVPSPRIFKTHSLQDGLKFLYPDTPFKQLDDNSFGIKVDSQIHLPASFTHAYSYISWHTNRIGSRKLLLKTVEIRLSGLANQRVRFCRFQQQSEALLASTMVPFLWPRGVWMVEDDEDHNTPKGLW
jgi:hypothetical protein